MSPPETTKLDGLLEHPAEAFDAFRRDGVEKLICEEKHMGSRAIVAICRDAGVAARRFGAPGSDSIGAIYTRTGRAFFSDVALEGALLDHVRASFDALDLWSEMETDWAILDCELLPWSAKAMELLRSQYASVGAAAMASTSAEADVWAVVASRLDEAEPLATRSVERAEMAGKFVDSYRRYCWETEGLSGLRIAPFQVLATEGRVRALDAHPWHMSIAARLAENDSETFRATRTIDVVLGDESSESAAIDWWTAMTSEGGEGMVVKPVGVVVPTKRGMAQPGIKCRGPEYLRIIYGPDYTLPEQLVQLRQRNVNHKRSLAIREFSLGIEALERFVREEPLHCVHECVFGVLALESEPVDPRL